MKLTKRFAVAVMVSALASASFAGSCCSKKKPADCSPDGKAKQEKKEAKK